MTREELAAIQEETLADFSLLLGTLIKSASSIVAKYDKKLLAGGPGSCHPFSAEAMTWNANYIDKNTCLKGLGAGLIIGADEFLEAYAKGHKLFKRVHEYFDIGPKLQSEYWYRAVNAASNYVRHSREWHEYFLQYAQATGGTISMDNHTFEREILPAFDRSKEPGQTQAAKNIRHLISAGLMGIDLITGDMNYFYLAERIKLTELDFSLKAFGQLQSELGARYFQRI